MEEGPSCMAINHGSGGNQFNNLTFVVMMTNNYTVIVLNYLIIWKCMDYLLHFPSLSACTEHWQDLSVENRMIWPEICFIALVNKTSSLLNLQEHRNAGNKKAEDSN